VTQKCRLNQRRWIFIGYTILETHTTTYYRGVAMLLSLIEIFIGSIC